MREPGSSVLPGSRTVTVLAGLAAVAVLVALWFTLIYAPTERIEGDVQRLLYVHVPAALAMYVAYALLTFASLMYLLQRRVRWDEVAVAAAEVATLFATIVLTTGPIWARPVWGTWWTWDARLTSSLLLWLILAAYLMLRVYADSPQAAARYGAVLALFGFLDLPIIHYSVRWWRTLHPDPKLMTEGGIGAGLAPEMLAALAVGIGAGLVLLAALLALRLRAERLERAVRQLHASAQRREDPLP